MTRNLKRGLFEMIEIFKAYIIFSLVLFINFIIQFVIRKGIGLEKILSSSNTHVIIIISLIWALAFTMRFQVAGFRDAIGFSTTRKSFYITVQIFKIIFSIFTLLMCLLYNAVISKIFNSIINLSPLVIFSSTLFMASLGEMLGNFINMFNKTVLGIKLIIITIIIVSMSLSLLTIVIISGGINIDLHITSISFTALSVSVFLSIINWFLIKKCSLK